MAPYLWYFQKCNWHEEFTIRPDCQSIPAMYSDACFIARSSTLWDSFVKGNGEVGASEPTKR